MKQKLLARGLFRPIMLLLVLLGMGSRQAWADNYELVTSASDLEVDAEYLIVNTAGTKAAGATSTTSTKYATVVDVVLSDNTISPGSDVAVYTLGGSADGWTFYSSKDEKYLTWTSGNSLNVNATVSNNTKWTITIGESGTTIANVATTTRIIRFNSDRFACYTTNTGTLVNLYKKVDTPSSPLASISVDASGATTTFNQGAAFSHDGVEVTATYEDESTKDVTSSAVFSTPDMTTTGTKTVTVSYTEGEVTKTATYDITVNEYVQPTEFSISLNDAFFGTNYGGSAAGISDDAPVSGISDNVTVTYAGAGDHYINNSQIRFYPNNKLTVEAPSGYKISKIEFTADGTWTATISADCGTYADTKTWTGDAASVVFTGSGSGQCRMSSMAITLADPNAKPTPTVTINVPQSFNTDLAGKTNVSAGTLTASVTHDDSDVAGATVTWSSSDPAVATINATGDVTLVAKGEVTITATFAGNDDYAAATGIYELTVDNSMAKGGANNPYTVTEALDATAGTECYVQGIVCSVSSTSVNSNGQIHYYISADGTEDGDVMNIYNGLGLNRAAFTSIDDIAVGDQVVVCGTISTYNNANQMAANNYLYSHITKDASNLTKTGDITLSAGNLSTTATAAQFFTTSSTGAITYEIANTTVATVNAEGVVTPVAAGATTLTVSQAADASYKAGSIEITVTVQAATKEDPITYDTDKELAYGQTFTLTYNDDYLTDGQVTMVSSNKAVASVKGLTITAAAVGTATITVTYAAGVTYNAGNSTFTVTVTSPAASEDALASSFQKVTATDDITAGQYLIVYEGKDASVAFDGSLETLDAVGNTIDVTISEGAIAATDATTAAAFTIDPEAGTLTNAAGKYIGKTASGNGLDVKYEAITNTFAIDNGNAVITASGGSVLKYNSNSNQNRFRYYGSGQQAIQLYKLSSGPTVQLNGSGYATYCSEYPLDFRDAEANGYSAWAVTGVEGKNITFSQITGTVPGGTGVLLKGTAGATVQLVSAASNSEPENLLEGTLAPTYVEANQYYGLSGNTFKKINAGTVPAGKAMLPASAVNGSNVKAFTFVFGGTTTGVNAVDNGQWTMDNGAIFSLSGQRLAKPQKGINIINGKKVLVK